MSNVRGRIAVDVQFADSTTSAGVRSLKTITLQDATEYTTGKVAIVTGTVGTAQEAIVFSSYKDATDEPIGSVTSLRIAFASQALARLIVEESPGPNIVMLSRDGEVSISNTVDVGEVYVQRVGTSGTASYTLVLYGT